MLRPGPSGSYGFLPGIAPYSAGVVAAPGYQVVHVVLRSPIPYRDGFARAAGHLQEAGRPRTALCAVELRIPAPLSFAGFTAFNEAYRGLLAEWGILLDGVNPVARTNVAPVVAPPAEPALYGFAYTAPGEAAGPTFVVAGSGELRGDVMEASAVVRGGEFGPEAMRDKARYVMGVMADRLRQLGGGWDAVTAIQVYTPHPVHGLLADIVLKLAGPAAPHGIRWFLSRPPIEGLEFEMDMRGVARELCI